MHQEVSNQAAERSVRVLVVDDHRPVVELAQSSLSRREGIDEVLAETDATAALDRVREGAAVDCLLCDFAMPSMDGLELVERVREYRSDLPIVLFTGSTSGQYAERDALDMVDGIVRKDGTRGTYDRLYERIVSLVG